jgi:hypothetical protein
MFSEFSGECPCPLFNQLVLSLGIFQSLNVIDAYMNYVLKQCWDNICLTKKGLVPIIWETCLWLGGKNEFTKCKSEIVFTLKS